LDLASIGVLAALGVAAGTFGSMLGVGGGMLVVPFLTTFFPAAFGFPQARATSLLAVIATSTGVAVATGRDRFVNVRLGISLAVPTTLAALLAGLLAAYANRSLLFGLFAAVLAINALLMWRPEREENGAGETHDEAPLGALDGSYVDPKTGERCSYRVKRVGGAMALSAAAGTMSALLGVGGGIFQVPGMNVLAGVPMRAAVATSNFLLGVTAVASAAVYWGRGDVKPLESAAVILGVLAGAFLGSAIARRLHGNTLRRLFSLVLVALAVQMARKAGGA